MWPARRNRKEKKSTRGDGLRAKINRLARLEKRAFGRRSGQFDFYNYLEAVLRMYWSWEDDGARKTRREKVAKLYGIPARKGRKGLHVLIEATSQQNSQTKNRWVQALQFAAKHRPGIEKKGFEAFCQANGGIAGCAREWAARKKSLKTASLPRLRSLNNLSPPAPTPNVHAPSPTLAPPDSSQPNGAIDIESEDVSTRGRSGRPVWGALAAGSVTRNTIGSCPARCASASPGKRRLRQSR